MCLNSLDAIGGFSFLWDTCIKKKKTTSEEIVSALSR